MKRRMIIREERRKKVEKYPYIKSVVERIDNMCVPCSVV